MAWNKFDFIFRVLSGLFVADLNLKARFDSADYIAATVF